MPQWRWQVEKEGKGGGKRIGPPFSSVVQRLLYRMLGWEEYSRT